MSATPGGRIALVEAAEDEPPPSGRVARLGLALRAHPRRITVLQILMVVCYLTLLVWPVLLPLPGDDDRILGHPARFAQFLFWGLWWPGVIVAVMLAGRFWCGVLCPEGALSEWVSRVGLGRGMGGGRVGGGGVVRGGGVGGWGGGGGGGGGYSALDEVAVVALGGFHSDHGLRAVGQCL